MKKLQVFICLFMVGCAAAPSSLVVQPQPQSLQLTDLEARVLRLERLLNNESLFELANQLSRLQSEIQILRGEIETQRFELDGNANRQRQLYIDLDDRLQSLEYLKAMMESNAPVVVVTPNDFQPEFISASDNEEFQATNNDQDAYESAYSLLQSGEYTQAASSLALFLVDYPYSDLTDNAQYWLAESYYARQLYDGALANFETVIRDYPTSLKIPDALLKIGFSYHGIGMNQEAIDALSVVASDYPDTTAARLAIQRMERIAEEQ
jgi:tol-pal system protein YbgF